MYPCCGVHEAKNSSVVMLPVSLPQAWHPDLASLQWPGRVSRRQHHTPEFRPRRGVACRGKWAISVLAAICGSENRVCGTYFPDASDVTAASASRASLG